MFREDHCANCAATLDMANRMLFCGKGCQEQAKLVRYLRTGIDKGKFLPVALRYGIGRDENEAKAVCSKLRFALRGGYNRSTNRSERAAVIERDGGRCRRCGEPGAEVDHISGDGGGMLNRQLLCVNCHDEKTLRGMPGIRGLQGSDREPTWSSALRDLVRRQPQAGSLIKARVLPRDPVRWCDTTQWDSVRSRLKSERQARLRESLKALYDGEVPDFAPRTPWDAKVAGAREHHAVVHDETPCADSDCSECRPRSFADGDMWDDPADASAWTEAWLDDPDVHAGYGEGSYFAESAAEDD
ncbi:HNH endonuclease [Streptomyces cirratus]|nr:HNH endonuclease signature motif containing protein [Streptomyces cirratus]